MSDITGSIAALYVYPIKSCAGLPVDAVELAAHGLLHDRQWLIVDQDGRFQTQRQIPHLVWITPSIGVNTLTLSAPNQPDLTIPIIDADDSNPFGTRTVQIWNDRLTAIDVGASANQWLDEYLQVPGKSFHLVQFDTRATRLSDPKWTGAHRSPVQFADGYAINVISQATLDQFNDKLLSRGIESVGADRFRPNVVIAGLQAHDEDNIQTVTIQTPAGPVQWALVKPCPRCQIPDIDPQTSISDPAVTQVLSSYRQIPQMDHAICFGMNGIVTAGAGRLLRVGQSLQATFNV